MIFFRILSRFFRREYVLSFLISFYLLVTIIWLFPDSDARTRLLEPIRLVWLFWGLDQNWALFSPSIRNVNYHTTATVTFEDGSKAVFEPYRMDKLGYWERFRLEKYRKLNIDSLPWEPFKAYWIDFARFAGRKLYDSRNKPVTFALSLHWIEIPEPGEKLVPREHLPEQTKFNNVFCYRFRDEDFK